MKSDIAIQPSVLSYIPLEPNIKDLTDLAIIEFKKKSILDAEGDAIEIPDNLHAVSYAVFLSAIYACAKELIIQLEDGRKALIFSHILPELYIHPRAIITKVFDEIGMIKSESFKDKKQKDIQIDISEIWNAIPSDKDTIERTISFLKKVSKKLAYHHEIEIIGDIPALPLLSAIYLMRGYGTKIFYVTKGGKKINLF